MPPLPIFRCFSTHLSQCGSGIWGQLAPTVLARLETCIRCLNTMGTEAMPGSWFRSIRIGSENTFAASMFLLSSIQKRSVSSLIWYSCPVYPRYLFLCACRHSCAAQRDAPRFGLTGKDFVILAADGQARQRGHRQRASKFITASGE